MESRKKRRQEKKLWNNCENHPEYGVQNYGERTVAGILGDAKYVETPLVDVFKLLCGLSRVRKRLRMQVKEDF